MHVFFARSIRYILRAFADLCQSLKGSGRWQAGWKREQNFQDLNKVRSQSPKMPPPPEEENDWPQWRRLGIILLVCLILNVTFGALVLVTTPSAPPPFEHKQMELTSPRPLVIYPDLPEEVRWWARITTKSKGFQFNATTIYYWDTTTMKSMTSTSTTSTSMTSTTTTRTSTANTSGSTASMINTSTTSTTKPEAVEKVVIYRPGMSNLLCNFLSWFINVAWYFSYGRKQSIHMGDWRWHGQNHVSRHVLETETPTPRPIQISHLPKGYRTFRHSWISRYWLLQGSYLPEVYEEGHFVSSAQL